MKKGDCKNHMDEPSVRIEDMKMEDFVLEGDETEEPETWTLISALDSTLERAKGSKLNEAFWERCKSPINYLTSQLGLTRMQVVLLGILIEAGELLTWRKLGRYLNCSRLAVMTYSDEIEDLLAKRWIFRRWMHESGERQEGFALVPGVVFALRHNIPFVPEKMEDLTEQEFVDKLECRLDKTLHDMFLEFEDDERWMLNLCKANLHLPLCHEVLELDDIHEQSLLLLIVFDYAQFADSEDEGLTYETINDTYPEEFECNGLRRNLRNGTHTLIQRGLIEHKCDEGIADAERYMLTRKTKEELLAAYKPSRSKVHTPAKGNRQLKPFASIREKDLFFNPAEQEQVDRLASLLSQENLPAIQQRLEEQGMRKGFACLFYGGPGTGKTETVLQIARKTGRDIMQIDIAGMRDKWVGESEKNIKGVFARYKEVCRNADIMPILFFNEADGIFGKRTQNIERSVEKMDNAMQNIILQEIEDLEGILIATTNLTQNLDPAFERRFLFKVEFHKPAAEVKAKIWCSMLKNIREDEALALATKFDFSGGQIENIARKGAIDYILSGKEADLETIEGYCRNELLEDKNVCKPVVGFG